MLLLIGCNHRSAPISLRERLSVGETRLPELLQALTRPEGITEAFVLSTCNRVELLVRTNRRPEEAAMALRNFLHLESGVSEAEIERHTYQHAGREAARHLFSVAVGLDSMILGEPQILGQVRQSYLVARETGTTGLVLERLLQLCLANAKRVRTETGIARHSVSVGFAAVELARQIFGPLGESRVLLLGAGKMSEMVARQLCQRGAKEVVVASRTFRHAQAAAERCGGTVVNWEDVWSQLDRADIVVSCTGAAQPILGRERVASALRARRGRPLFLIDIAVPRDIEPSVNELDNVYLYDIDGLQGVVDANLETRRRAAEQAQAMIETDLDAFERWRQSLELGPAIRALREQWLALGRHELARLRRRCGPLSTAQEAAMEELTRGLIHKLLHRPIIELRRATERGEVERYLGLYRELFSLDRGDGERIDGPMDDAAPGGDDLAPPGPQRLVRGGRED